MQIVANINENDYKTLMINGGNCSLSMAERIVKSVHQGEKLPKRHGDLIDRAELIKAISKCHIGGYEAIMSGEFDFYTDGLCEATKCIESMDAIVEADTESEVEENG